MMNACDERVITLYMGVDAWGLRRSGPSERELVTLSAADLRQAQTMSREIDNAYATIPHSTLLHIDTRASLEASENCLRIPTGVRSLASLLYDIAAVGIADGAVVSVDATTDVSELWNAVADDLRSHGYCVVDHVPGWAPDGWESACVRLASDEPEVTVAH
jgi:hypothetical protein